MQFFSVGQEAEGFIAIGQRATGVIAIGQMATGVVAIGQLARGVFTLGMLSVGVVSVGMLSVGLVHSTTMLGLAARGKGMLLLTLCPKVPTTSRLPEPSPRDALEAGRLSGWIKVLVERASTGLALVADGRPLRAKLGADMIAAASQALVQGAPVLAYLVPSAHPNQAMRAEVSRLMRMPAPTWRSPQYLLTSAAQLAGLAIVSAGYFYIGFVPVIDGVLMIMKD